jgi:hypothetical protein
MTTITRLTPGANDPAAIRDAAAQYIAAGIRVLPTEPETKKPAHKGWQTEATLDPDKLPAFWPDRERYGVGLAMGAWANTAEFGTYLVCVDLDRKPDAANGVEAFQRLVNEHGGDMGNPWVQETPSGGLHLVYQVEHQHGNGTGRLPAGIDVRGEGGQIIAAPTAGKGERRWVTGHAPSDHAPGFAPTWLVDLLQPPTLTPSLPPVVKEKGDTAKPGDRYNSTANWGDLLTRNGWRYLQDRTDRGHTVQDWERPGQIEKGKSGGTLHPEQGQAGVFYVWSGTWAAQLPSDLREHSKSYKAALSPFAFYAVTEHGGDMKAAARHLAAEYRKADDETLSRLGRDLGQPDTQGGEQKQTPDTEPEGWSVRFTTLADYTGDLDPRQPTLLMMTNGLGLLYADAENLVWGAPGCGKSWLANLATLQEIQAGRRVLVVDYEMSQRDWVTRLRLAGATQEQLRLVEYVAPQEALRLQRYANGAPTEDSTIAGDILAKELAAAAKRGPISLAIIDGVSEMISSNNLGSNDAEDIAKMWNALPRLITNATGAGVLGLDHVAKQAVLAKQKDIMPFGSQHKLSRVKGAGFSAWATMQPSKLEHGGQVGLLHLHCKKDRHGGVGQGRDIATLEITPLRQGKVSLRLLPFEAERATQGQSHEDQTLAALLQLVYKLNSERHLLGRHKVSSRLLAREMTNAGHKMSHTTCEKHLAILQGNGLVINAGTGGPGGSGDWVPTNSDQLPI